MIDILTAVFIMPERIEIRGATQQQNQYVMEHVVNCHPENRKRFRECVREAKILYVTNINGANNE